MPLHSSRLASLALIAALLATSSAGAQTLAVAPKVTSTRDRQLEKFWVRMDLGGSGVLIPGTPTAAGYGIHLLGLRLEWPQAALLLAPRVTVARRTDGRGELVNVVASLGGRYLLTPTRTSLFVGAGLAPGLWSGGDPSGQDRMMKGSGVGGYVEAGVEVFRSTWHQLSFGLRVDAPFYRTRNTETGNSAFPVPISLDATFSTEWPKLWL